MFSAPLWLRLRSVGGACASVGCGGAPQRRTFGGMVSCGGSDSAFRVWAVEPLDLEA